jgi:hypothetical protein
MVLFLSALSALSPLPSPLLPPSLTPKLLKTTKEISSYMNPVGFLIDKNIPVHVCTFRGIYTASRSEQLFDIVTKCKLSVANMLKLVSSGFM